MLEALVGGGGCERFRFDRCEFRSVGQCKMIEMSRNLAVEARTRLAVPRQEDIEHASLADVALEVDFATEKFAEFLDDRESQSRASVFPRQAISMYRRTLAE